MAKGDTPNTVLSKEEKKLRQKLYSEIKTKDPVQLKKEKKRIKAERDASGDGLRQTHRLRRYKLQPNNQQVLVICQWLVDANRSYNLALAELRRRGVLEFKRGQDPPDWKNLETALREQFVSGNGLAALPARLHLLARTPKEIRSEAVRGCLANVKTAWTKFEKFCYVEAKYGSKHPWKYNPRPKATKRPQTGAITIPGKSLTAHNIAKCQSDDEDQPGQSDDEDQPGQSDDEDQPGQSDDEDQHGQPTLDVYRVWNYHNPFNRVVNATLKRTLSRLPTCGRREHATQYPTRCIPFARHSKPFDLVEGDLDVYCQLVYRWGQVFLHVPYACDPHSPVSTTHPIQNPPDRDERVALDPGIRKFLTAYSPQGRVEYLGTNTGAVVDKLTRRIDRCRLAQRRKLAWLRAPTRRGENRRLSRKRKRRALWWAKRARHLAEQKAVNVIRDLHYKTAHHLLRNYKHIFLPTFNAHAIAKHCRLTRRVKRRLNTLSFYQFRLRLLDTLQFYQGAEIHTGSEAYTSKTCGRCGELNDQLGSSETFHCPSCGLRADRDAHAARNILLRHLS